MEKHSKKKPLIKRKRRKNDTEKVYFPPSGNMSPLQLAIGLILRTLIVYLGIFGLSCFICGAAGLTVSEYWRAVTVSPGYIALFSAVPAIACCIASLGKPWAWGTAAVYTGAYAAVIAALYGNPITFTVRAALRVYNFALHTLAGLGYTSFGDYMVSDGYDYANASYATSDPTRFWGVFLLCTLIGLILYFTVQKKVRLIPLILFVSAIAAPVLTYNLAKGTAGIGFSIVFVTAALALKIYDRRYNGSAQRRREKKEARKQKKEAAKEKRLSLRAEKYALKNSALRVYNAALSAGADESEAKKAKNVFYSAMRRGKKADRKKNAKLERNVEETLRNKGSQKKEALTEEQKKELRRRRQLLKKQKKEEKKKAGAAKRAEKKAKAKNSRRISYAGGYHATGVALAVFLAVWLPMAAVSGPFRIIDPINNKVKIARAYFTAYLKGDDIDLNELYAYGIDDLSPRQLSFEALEYKDKNVFRVETEGIAPVYLRSWIGTDFIWDEQKWQSADYNAVLSYRERFGKDFTPDSITTDFYSNVYPSSGEISERNEYKNFSKYGFFVQQVNVWRNSGDSLLLFIPSHMNTRIGLTKYGYLDDAEYKYSKYFDGVYSSRFYKYGKGYSTVSYISNFSRQDAGKSFDSSLEYYQRCKNFILDNKNRNASEINRLLYDFDRSLQEDGIEYIGTNLADRYFNNMTGTQKAALLSGFETEALYAQYAAEKYTEKTGSAAIEEVADSIRSSLPDNASVYETVRAVADYFNQNYKYTTEPDTSRYDGTKPVLEAFLTDVKEGYCTHFATAACALLREFDLPVRYAEGYVASGFEPAIGQKSASMRTYVKDSDAHAWVEVYIGGIGWTQFEVTPGEHYDNMYSLSSATIVPPENNEPIQPEDDPNVSPAPDNTDTPDTSLPIIDGIDEGETDLIWFAKRIAIGASAAVFIAIIWLLIRHIRKKAAGAVADRYRVIDLARNEDSYRDERIDNRKTARKINDAILDIYSLMGSPPRAGEQYSEYALRMQSEHGELSGIDAADVIEAMQKEEFGHGLTFEEMYMCAEYLSDITTAVYNDLSLWKKILLRYIKRRI